MWEAIKEDLYSAGEAHTKRQKRRWKQTTFPRVSTLVYNPNPQICIDIV